MQKLLIPKKLLPGVEIRRGQAIVTASLDTRWDGGAKSRDVALVQLGNLIDYQIVKMLQVGVSDECGLAAVHAPAAR
jgi:hypothetical protein